MMNEVYARKIIEEWHRRLAIEVPFEVVMTAFQVPPAMHHEKKFVVYLIDVAADDWKVSEQAWRANLGDKFHPLLTTARFTNDTTQSMIETFEVMAEPVIYGWAFKHALQAFSEDEIKDYSKLMHRAGRDALKMVREGVIKEATFVPAMKYVAFNAVLKMSGLNKYAKKLNFDLDPLTATYVEHMVRALEQSPAPAVLVDVFNKATPAPANASIVDTGGIEAYKIKQELLVEA